MKRKTAEAQPTLLPPEEPSTVTAEPPAIPVNPVVTAVPESAPAKVASLPARVDQNLVLMFERLAKDPGVDVSKLERLIAMQERILAHQAKAAFAADFAQMQQHIPTIEEDGKITVEGRVRSNYATNEAIQSALKPVLAAHGFSLSFRTDFSSEPGKVKIIGELEHIAGHTKIAEFVGPADTSGSKNAIQALGSTQSYGQRYTTKALLNIVSHLPIDRDDDGQAAGKTLPKPAQRKSTSRDYRPGPEAGPAPASREPERPTEPVSGPSAGPGPGSPAASKPVGVVVNVEQRGPGHLAQLDTGFICSTKDPAMVESLLALKASGRRVELLTHPSRDPSRFAPVLEEIAPVK